MTLDEIRDALAGVQDTVAWLATGDEATEEELHGRKEAIARAQCLLINCTNALSDHVLTQEARESTSRQWQALIDEGSPIVRVRL